MATLRAPFNFVPLSSTVFFPEWANQISQDVPFSDGIDGTIELKITAQSPIFVRNGHTREDKDTKNDAYKSFSKTFDGRFFIPATSMKGCIRNVLEIMSFGKIAAIQNESFGIRDLSGNTADGKFYKNKIKPENVHCGWLWKEDNGYYIDDCDLPWRISPKELDEKWGRGLEKFDTKGDFKDDHNRTALKKYELFKGIDLKGTFSPDEELRESLGGSRQFVRFNDRGEKGIVVFTGQPGIRKPPEKNGKWTGKYFEFVFPEEVRVPKIQVDPSVFKQFESIHKDSPDYKDFRKGQLNKSEKIPVFFMYDEDEEVDSIGLSYMYKYPAYNSVYNAIRKEDLDKSKLDLAECIFGVSNIKHTLKGRVQFGPAFVEGAAKELGEIDLVLSSPHPSYYPLYLGNGQTWNSEDARIAGFKRYPVRSSTMPPTIGTKDMISTIKPLAENTTFTETLYFHNLRASELGAVLSAILFHGDKRFSHNIGSAKPLGYGKIKIDVESIHASNANDQIQYYLDCFEHEMDQHIPSWKESVSMKEFFIMAMGIPSGKESDFTYMHMDTNRKKNEFLTARDEYAQGIQLGTFSQIKSGTVPPSAFIGNVSANKRRKNIEKQLEEEKKKNEQYKEHFSLGVQKFDLGSMEEAKNEFSEAKKYASLGSMAEIDVYLNEIADLEKQRRDKVNAIIEIADKLYNDKKYEEAKAKYIEAGSFGIIDVSHKIKLCEDAINPPVVPIEDFVACSSLGAFSGSLKKWLTVYGELNDKDFLKVANKMKVEIEKLNKKKQKDWKDWNKWKVVVDAIGEELANKLFKQIKS